MASGVSSLQVIAIFVFFIEAFVGGMLPSWSANFKNSPKKMGLANALAGGVFVSIAFIHILPE
jgi:hypothetical protein